MDPLAVILCRPHLENSLSAEGNGRAKQNENSRTSFNGAYCRYTGQYALTVLQEEVRTMWNIPSEKRLERMPRLYATEKTALGEKVIHLHFFLGGCDWYIAEYDGKDLFWGYAILNGDYQNAEWGYVSFRELKELRTREGFEVDCEAEEFWSPRKTSEIKEIVESGGV